MPQVAAAAVTGAAAIYGAKKASDANKKATATTSKAADDALAYQKEKDAQDRADAKAQWDAMQALKAPYRQTLSGLAAQFAQRNGLTTTPPPAPPMPAGWSPGMPIPTASAANGTGVASNVSAPDYSQSSSGRTLSSLAGMPSSTQVVPQLSLSDVLNGTWNRRVS